jgi:hypothetical protein
MSPPRRKRRQPKILYSRELPGGGYVTIQSEPVDESSFRGWISVERRSDRNRRDSAGTPIIAEVQAASTDVLFTSLHEIACDNVAVARAIQLWESEHPQIPPAHT